MELSTLLVLAILAGLISHSRTSALVGLPLMWWYIRYRTRIAAVLIAAGLALLLVAEMVGEDSLAVPLFQRWSDRIEELRTSTSYRVDAATGVLMGGGSLMEILFGHGLGSQAYLAIQLASRMGTLDNTYVSLFYETGVSGIVFYFSVFGYLLWHFRHLRNGKAHYCALVGLLLAGVSFQSYNFYTFNFVAAASIASLFWYAEEQPETHQGPTASQVAA